MVFSTKDLIIAIPAFFGMILGVYNLLRDVIKNRVRLKLIPKSAVALGKDRDGSSLFGWSKDFYDPTKNSEHFAIEVVNLSGFSVTLSRVGFYTRGGKRVIQIPKPALIDHSEWPRRLKPHESCTVVVPIDEVLKQKSLLDVIAAFAETQSGIIRKGKSKALVQLVQYAINAQLEK